MKATFSSLISLVFVFPTHFVYSDEKEPVLTSYQKAIRGLATKEIRPHLVSEKMFDLCIPTWKRSLGRFTEYEFDCIPGYHGLGIIAKNGLLKRATEWSCTYTRTHFNEMTPDDEKDYQQLRKDNADVPFDRCIGRLGWQRPRMREWRREEAEPARAPR
jgi:hypothetical protein